MLEPSIGRSGARDRIVASLGMQYASDATSATLLMATRIEVRRKLSAVTTDLQ